MMSALVKKLFACAATVLMAGCGDARVDDTRADQSDKTVMDVSCTNEITFSKASIEQSGTQHIISYGAALSRDDILASANDGHDAERANARRHFIETIADKLESARASYACDTTETAPRLNIAFLDVTGESSDAIAAVDLPRYASGDFDSQTSVLSMMIVTSRMQSLEDKYALETGEPSPERAFTHDSAAFDNQLDAYVDTAMKSFNGIDDFDRVKDDPVVANLFAPVKHFFGTMGVPHQQTRMMGMH